jgi:hypothetical protein
VALFEQGLTQMPQAAVTGLVAASVLLRQRPVTRASPVPVRLSWQFDEVHVPIVQRCLMFREARVVSAGSE